jgi:O-antigen ligase
MKDRILFVYSIFLVVLLFAVHYFNEISLFYVLITAILFIIAKPIYITPVYFISSLSGSFYAVPNGIGSVSRYISVLLILSLLIQLIRSKNLAKKSIFNNTLFITLILFNFFSSALSLSTSFNSFFLILQNLLILFLFSKYKTIDISSVYKLLFLSAYITFLLIIFELYFKGTNIFFIQSRLSINEEVNENRFGMMLVQLGVIILFPLFRTNSSISIKIISSITLPLIIILIVLTGSRTSLIAYLLTLFITYLFLYKKLSFGKLVIMLMFFLTIFFTWNFLLEIVPFMNRFTLSNVTESGGAHRFGSIVILLKEIIPSHPLFGIGLGGENTMIALKRFGQGLLPAHNIIIDMLTQIGLIGFVLYFYLFKKIIQKILSQRSLDSIMYMPIMIVIAALINGIGETIFFEKFLWNGLALGVLFLNNLDSTDDSVQYDPEPEPVA